MHKCKSLGVFYLCLFYPHQVYTYFINTVKTVILWNIITVFNITIAGNCCNILWLIRWRISQTSFWRSRLIEVFYPPSQTTFLSLFTFVLGFRSAKMVFKTRCEVKVQGSRFKVQGSLLFVTYTIIQGIIGSEMLVGTGPLNGKCKKEK